MYRRKQRLLFDAWRKISHAEFKRRIDAYSETRRRQAESKELKFYSDKVDWLLLYMAQLEDKISSEQDSQKTLAQQYEQSLNHGVNKFSSETQQLAESPLVREISLLVA